MKRSAFAKLSDAIQFKPVVVTKEKVVVRRIVEPLRPQKAKTDPAIKRAQQEGQFLSAMRELADFESVAVTMERHWYRRDLAATIDALRTFEQTYAHTRTVIAALPSCTEKDCMMKILEKSDARAKQAWDWAISRASQLEGPAKSKAARQRRRRNKRQHAT